MPSLKASIENAKHISLDDVCFLHSIEIVEDELGQQIEVEIPRQVFCSKLSVTRHEFSAAGQLGHKPQMMIIVDSDEYDKEQSLAYEDVKYVIYKNFMRADGYTELYCEVRTGG